MICDEHGKLIMARWKGSPWARVKLREHKLCAVCGQDMVPRTEVFRPLDNPLFRAERICVSCMEKLSPPKGV